MLLTRKSTVLRRGFTLVESMVAAALSVTIMWILAESFKTGIDFARSAHSTGDMMSQLNNASQIMTRDFQAQRFLTPGAMRNPTSTSGSMPDTMNALPPTNIFAATGYTPPFGYFRLCSPPPSGLYNQSAFNFADDSTGMAITTTNANGASSNTGAYVAFTSFLPAGLPQNQFVTTAPAGSNNYYYSRAAEIALFIGGPGGLGQPTGFTAPVVVTPNLTNPTSSTYQQYLNSTPQPLYNLYRRQRLVAVTTDYAPQYTNAITPPTPTTPPQIAAQYDPNAQDVISFTVQPPPAPTQSPIYHPNILSDFGTSFTTSAGPLPATSFRYPLTGAGGPPQMLYPLTGARAGDDILLSNVLSFEVLATWVPSQLVTQPSTTKPIMQLPIPGPRPFTNPPNNPNTNYPFDNLPFVNLNNNVPSYTFDTWYQINMADPRRANNPNFAYNWNNFAHAPHNPNLIPMPIRITGLQITIRIYDAKTNQARQSTWRIAM